MGAQQDQQFVAGDLQLELETLMEETKAQLGSSPQKHFEQKMAQLGHRLKQMVLVHKSVLRKHAQAELNHRDTSKRVASRDRKISELEKSVATLKEHLHKQAHEQMEEMAKVRDHVTRLSTLGGGFFSKKRTLRGGGAPPALSAP